MCDYKYTFCVVFRVWLNVFSEVELAASWCKHVKQYKTLNSSTEWILHYVGRRKNIVLLTMYK